MQDSTVVHLNKLISTWLHNQTEEKTLCILINWNQFFLAIPTTFEAVWTL